MVTFKQRFKNDKKFRVFVSLAFLVVLSTIISSMPDKKTAATEAQCNAIFENDAAWKCWLECVVKPLTPCSSCYSQAITKPAFEECKDTAGCYVQASGDGSLFHGIQYLDGCFSYWIKNEVPLVEKCTTQVSTGDYIFDEEYGCEEHGGLEKNNVCGGTIYKCSIADPDTVCTNDLEYKIARVLPGDMDCKTKYFIVLFAGGMMLLMAVGTLL